MQRVYIAGKVTGEKLATVTAKFGQAQKDLEAKGYEVVNPLAVTAAACNPADGRWLDMPWQQAMQLTIAAMMTCQCVYMLSDWRFSKGATIEHDLAERLGMPVLYENEG